MNTLAPTAEVPPSDVLSGSASLHAEQVIQYSVMTAVTSEAGPCSATPN